MSDEQIKVSPNKEPLSNRELAKQTSNESMYDEDGGEMV